MAESAQERELVFIDETASKSLIDETIDSLSASDKLAFDTESDSFYRYHERVCLMQFSDSSRDYIYDPLSHGLVPKLRTVLEASDRTVFLHGGDFDVLSMRRDFDLKFGKLFDTLIAARCLGITSFGLASLLESILGIKISKSEQRSDWGRRPLTDKQIRYARQDTSDLLRLAESLSERIDKLDRMNWVTQDCELLRQREPKPKQFDPEGWRKLRGAAGLDPIARKVVCGLYLWRETEAKRRNRTPFRVISNDVIIDIGQLAQENPGNCVSQLRRVRGISSKMNLDGLRRALEQALRSSEIPPVKKPRKHSENKSRLRAKDPEAKQRLSRLKDARKRCAERANIEPSFLVSGSVLEEIAQLPPASVSELIKSMKLTNWRSELLETELWSAL